MFPRNDSTLSLGKGAYEGMRAHAARAYALGRREGWWHTTCVVGVAKTTAIFACTIGWHELHVPHALWHVFPRNDNLGSLGKGAYEGMRARAARAYAIGRQDGKWHTAGGAGVAKK